MRIRIEATEDELRERAAEIAKSLLEQLAKHDHRLGGLAAHIQDYEMHPLTAGQDTLDRVNSVVTEEFQSLLSDIETILSE